MFKNYKALEDSLSTLLLLGLAHAQSEKQKLRLQPQEQKRLTLETELAKPYPKEQVLFLITEPAPQSFAKNPVSLKSRECERKIRAPVQLLKQSQLASWRKWSITLTVSVGCSTLNNKAAKWRLLPLAANRYDPHFGSNTGYI